MNELAAGVVDLWVCVPEAIVEPALLASYEAMLDDEERARQQRFMFEKHRHQYLVSHGLVRWVLSQYAEVAPRDWTFCTNEYGRPEISNPGAHHPRLRFNLSHAEGMAVCAVTCVDDIGVDVEHVKRRADLRNIAHYFFAPGECESLKALDDEAMRRRFFEIWTLKEAYIKGRGMGLRLPLDGFGFEIGDFLSIYFEESVVDDPARWRFALLRLDEEHQLGLALAQTGAPLQLSLRQCIPCVSHRVIDEQLFVDLRLSR